MSPDELATLILSIFGVIVQLVLKYAPKVAEWYEAQPNKGLIALGCDVVIGGVLFGLSCTPYAAEFGVGLACEVGTLFLLLKAIFILALSQQAAYLFGRNRKR